MMREHFWGIDIGSITIKVVILDQAGRLLADRYFRSNGQAVSKLQNIIDLLITDFPENRIAAVRFTGSGGKQLGQMVGGKHINELIAQTRAVGEYYPQARTIIEIGGQDSKFLSVSWNPVLNELELVDFSLNSLCAAGTGSFLDQQAERLGISIDEEFAAVALKSTNPAQIAGRCSVFAKSDLIHLQQIGTPLCHILAGLCLAIARNYKCVVGKGKRFVSPYIFQGGVSMNRAVVQALETILKLEPGGLIVPQYNLLMPALGAAFSALDEAKQGPLPIFNGFGPLKDQALSQYPKNRRTLPSLTEISIPGSLQRVPISVNYADRLPLDRHESLFLGIDVGSISTNVVLVNPSGEVVVRRYRYSKGKPVDTVCHLLREIKSELNEGAPVSGVGVTGSGRHLIGYLVGADLLCNEISAQATAALHIDPEVDTIIEIGGQDSKYVSLQQGAIVDFALNKACAAGTGSFLQEQSDRLNISLHDDFSRLAMGANSPAHLGERCTVFMDSDLVHHQQQGAKIEDLAAGLAFSIAQNYLNRVVNRRVIGQNIFFQGGVAGNRSVATAFQYLIGRKLTVPPHYDVTGAIGAALLVKEEMIRRQSQGLSIATKFRGFDLIDEHPVTYRFECRACLNFCSVNKMDILGEPPIYFGARCDRFEKITHKKGKSSEIPDHFTHRNALLTAGYAPPVKRTSGKPRVGLPRALTYHDMFPYWRSFFDALEIDIVLSTPTNQRILRDSAENVTAEFCLPAKLIFGHVYDLTKLDVDYIFLPSVRNRENIAQGQGQNFYCPYIQTTPTLIKAHFEYAQVDQQFVTFPYYLLWPQVRRKMLKNLAHKLKRPLRKVQKAADIAANSQKTYYKKLRQRGREILNDLPDNKKAIVIVGRPYTTGDPAICHDLSFKLRTLGCLPLPMEYLPLESVDISDRFDNIYWRSGQDILAAAKLIRDHPRLHAIYLTNFGCGPDSFLITYFREIMGSKPFLLLEIDDHTADAGLITRCEVFLQSLNLCSGMTANE